MQALNTIKPTLEMIAAVRAVRPQERVAAARVAERTFLSRLAVLRQWGDFSEEEHLIIAGKAAAAEVSFRFA